MSLVDDAVQKIQSISDGDQRRRYARALIASVIWEGHADDRHPTAAADVLSTNLISPQGAESNMVLLTKAEVVQYASELGLDVSLAAFRKNFTGTSYTRYFSDRRQVVRNGLKVLITYAEARDFLGAPSRGEVDQVIYELAG